MKKVCSVLIYLLFVLTLLFPVGRVVSNLCGYRFELVSITGFAIGLAILSILAVGLDLSLAKNVDSKAICVIILMMPPMTLVNGLFLAVNSKTSWVIVSVFIYGACCFYLMVKHGRPVFLKVASTVLMLIGFAPTCLLGMVIGTAGLIIGEASVVNMVESPGGTYYAQVEQTGENTHVMLYENSGFNALLFRVRKQPRWLYSCGYSECETMDIYWKNDSCLMINSVPYELN